MKTILTDLWSCEICSDISDASDQYRQTEGETWYADLLEYESAGFDYSVFKKQLVSTAKIRRVRSYISCMPLVAFISTPELMLWFRLISYVLRPMGLISEREFILGTGIRGYEDTEDVV
jgi:hypothetical protein